MLRGVFLCFVIPSGTGVHEGVVDAGTLAPLQERLDEVLRLQREVSLYLLTKAKIERAYVRWRWLLFMFACR